MALESLRINGSGVDEGDEGMGHAGTLSLGGRRIDGAGRRAGGRAAR
jgi:hypothetical protein